MKVESLLTPKAFLCYLELILTRFMSVPYLLQHTKAGVPRPDVSSITLNLVKELYPQEWGQQLRSPNLFQGADTLPGSSRSTLS